MPIDSPICINVKSYKGHDPTKLARYRADIEAAQKLEKYLNEKHVEGKPASMTYYDIASDLCMNEATVKRLLSPVFGGNTGITI